jgi:hypothetical protein
LTRIGVRDVVGASYSRRVNRVGSCTVLLDAKRNDFEVFSQEDLGLIIGVADENNPVMTPDLDAFWLLTDFAYYGDDSGIYELGFVDALDILRRHRIAYFADEPIGASPQARIDLPGNVALKRIFDENLGQLALLRSLDPYLTSRAVAFPSPIINRTLQWKNVLSAMTQIAKSSREQGTALFFDIIAKESNQFGVLLEFVTFTDARGKDHTVGNMADVRIRTSDPNFRLEKFAIDFDYPNYAYVAGSGRGVNRPLVEVFSDRKDIGIFSRRETYKSVQTTDTNVLEDEGYELINGQGIYSLQGELLGEFALTYKFGDKLNFEHEGLLITAEISHVKVDIAGETYTKKLRIESS